MIIRSIKRVERLAMSIFGVSASSVPPARATSAGRRLTSGGRKKAALITTDVESEQMPSGKRQRNLLDEATSSKEAFLRIMGKAVINNARQDETVQGGFHL